MIEVDFTHVEDIGDYEPLPAGPYKCKLADIEEGSSSKGHEMWKLRFTVEDGEYAGRCIFDRLTFSPSALKRVKLLCSCLDIQVEGKVELAPGMLLDKLCVVHVGQEDYTDPEGCTRRVNAVLFSGFEPLRSETDADQPE